MDAPRTITALATGEKIDFEMDGHRIILKNLPEKSFDRHANIAVIKLEFDKSPRCRSGSYYPQMRGGENVAGDLVQ